MTRIVEAVIEDDRWHAHDLDTLAEDAVRAVLSDAGLGDGFEVALLACDDTRIAALNGAFRGRTSPTDVLSWPSRDRRPGDAPGGPELGDVAIAYDACARGAAARGTAFEAHVGHLIVHAALHLLGHDHETDGDAEAMESAERRILRNLGLPDPYADDVT